jgi:hypothetical protein
MIGREASRRDVALVAALAVTAMLSGCGGAGVPASRGLTAAEFNFLAGNDAVAAGGAFLFRAQQTWTQRCMEQRGFRYIAQQQASLSPATIAENELTASGRAPAEATVLAARERSGYGIYDGRPGSSTNETGTPPTVTEENSYVQSLSPTGQQRYLMSDRICIMSALRTIYGGKRIADSITNTPQSIRTTLLTATQTNPRVVAATKRWSECFLAATGHQFANPAAVPNWLSSPGVLQTTVAFRSLEIRMAVADARCDYSSRLAQTYSRVFRERADHLTAGEEGELLSTLSERQRAITRAEAALQNLS